MYEEPADANHDAIDQAYRTKCARHAGNYIEPTVSPDAIAGTLRLSRR